MYFCTVNGNSRVMICTLSSAHWQQASKVSALRRFQLIWKHWDKCAYQYYIIITSVFFLRGKARHCISTVRRHVTLFQFPRANCLELAAVWSPKCTYHLSLLSRSKLKHIIISSARRFHKCVCVGGGGFRGWVGEAGMTKFSDCVMWVCEFTDWALICDICVYVEVVFLCYVYALK